MVAALALLGALVIWLSNEGGLWWMTMLVGLILGFLIPSGRGILAAAVTGVAGWGLGLLWLAIQTPIGSTASAVSVTLGVGTGPLAAIVLTLALGGGLAASFAWLAVSIQRFARPAPADR